MEQLSMHFIHASTSYATKEKSIPAPYFRHTFCIEKRIRSAKLQICGLGFYEAHVNGLNITKGWFAPYRSNHDHYLYYDEYDITEHIRSGKNVLAVVLGNGMQNAFGASVWDMDKAVWRAAPQVSFRICLQYADGSTENIYSNETTRTAESPIIMNDLHWGEHYDARREIESWDAVGYDDGVWAFAKRTVAPRGELRLANVEPIRVRQEIKPVQVTKCGKGYLYDFGINTAGVCRLNVKASDRGQKIHLKYTEVLVDGEPFYGGIRFEYQGYYEPYQEDIYYCSGKTVETYTPRFTYHGFRYVYVEGIRPDQATDSLLTYLELCSELQIVGQFSCSDEMANRIQEAAVRSDYSCFHYFPTDCPQREKNGWTADAALSAEQLLLNLKAEHSFREWMLNIYKSMTSDGMIPGIIPTAGWGYEWGNGPAWDCVLVQIPYYTYRYRGDREILEECAVPLMRYLTYLYGRLDENNLVEFGLGDWCQINRKEEKFETPLIVTDSIVTIDIARKAEFIYEVLEMKEQKNYAKALGDIIHKAFREHLINFETMVVEGDTQTAQAMALYYELFEESEKAMAYAHLMKQLERTDYHMDVGVLGGRVLYRLLAENGNADLAYYMITREDFPSYGNLIVRGATTLWETFHEEGGLIRSMNHHFWGDVSAWFYYYPGGIRFNPTGKDVHHVEIRPDFLEKLEHAKASYQSPSGEIVVSWKRIKNETKGIQLSIQIPKTMHGTIYLPKGYRFADGTDECVLQEGVMVELICCAVK